MRVGTYARISQDSELGVARQEHDTSALTTLRGWRLAERYQDNDASAYQPKVERPDFERMLADLKAGVIQGIVVWDLDRLARRPVDLERIIDLYDQKPLVFATVQGDIDLSTPDGRTMARVLVAFANKASMDTARRVARKKLEKATNGVGFSNFRPFGWNEDRLTLRGPEAQILRQAASDVLAGTGLFVICGRLNRAGIHTARGKTWKTYAMRRVLRAPRIAGFAVYQNELLTDSSGRPIRGKWEPILDEATWRAVVEATANGPKRDRPQGYLLTNVARCGVCGTGMIGTRAKGSFRYQCRSVDSGGCAGVCISGPRLQEQIEALLFAYLDGREVEPDETWSGQSRLDEITAKIGELMEQYRIGLSGSIVFPMIRKLESEQQELSAEQTRFHRLQHPKPGTRVGGGADMDVYAKRAVIQSVIEAIVIKPSAERPGRYDPNRVDVVPLR